MNPTHRFFSRSKRLIIACVLAMSLLVCSFGIVSAQVTPHQVIGGETCSQQVNADNCNGGYPGPQGCNDAQVLSGQPAIVTDNGGHNIGEVWLEWSNKCQSNWATALVISGYTGTETIHRESGPDGGAEYFWQTVPGTTSWVDSRMVYAPDNTAYACLTIGSNSNCIHP